MSSEGVRIGVLTDPYVEAYRAEALRAALTEMNAEISYVVVDSRELDDESASRERSRSSLSGRLARKCRSLWEHGGWSLINFERRLMRRLFGNPRFHSHHERKPVEKLSVFDRAELEYCQPTEMDENWVTFPSEVVSSFEEKTDVIVRFGFGLVTGDILTATEYGVLSFHPADIRTYRGLGPTLMFVNGDDEITVTLQRLTDTIDGGEVVLFSSTTADVHTYDDLMSEIADLKIDMLPEGLERVQQNALESYGPTELGDYYPVSTREQFGFATKFILKDLFRNIYRYVIKRN